jgi:hypothetical protein
MIITKTLEVLDSTIPQHIIVSVDYVNRDISSIVSVTLKQEDRQEIDIRGTIDVVLGVLGVQKGFECFVNEIDWEEVYREYMYDLKHESNE